MLGWPLDYDWLKALSYDSDPKEHVEEHPGYTGVFIYMLLLV